MDVLLTALGLFGVLPILCMTVLYGVVPVALIGLQVVGLLAPGDRPGFAVAPSVAPAVGAHGPSVDPAPVAVEVAGTRAA